MAQIFPDWANKVPAYAVGAVAALAALAPIGVWYWFSPEFTDVGYQPIQPVPYSHALHVGEMGLDCRYCHSSVERSAMATVPPTQTCMNCHQLVKRDSPKLAAIRDSVENDMPMQWIRVHKLGEYAYFDHSIHVRAGVGCSSCHGDIASMEVVHQAEPLSMAWCLDCHRNPQSHIRPRDQITNTSWQPPENQTELAAQIIADRRLKPPEDCSACHR